MSLIDDIQAAAKALEALGPPGPTAYRAHPASLELLRRRLDPPADEPPNPFLSIRLHRDVTLEPGEFVPVTAEEERVWLQGLAPELPPA